MNRFFVYITLIILLAVAFGYFTKSNPLFLSHLLTYSVCDQPILYKVGIVDPKFNLSKDEFLSDVNQAAQIWNKPLDKKLFAYNLKGDLSVNLIYDERQSLVTQVNQLEDTVKYDKQSLTPEISEYQKKSAQLKQNIADLNKQIEYWNNNGGAPPEEYQKLIKQQQDLQNEAKKLNALAQNLNASTNAYNSQVYQLNQTISSLNTALEEKPEEGIFKYPENVIDVYFNNNQQELIHTLAHELGHSIGLTHLSNPKDIMYFKTNQSTLPSQDDIQALETLCRRHPIFELIQTYLSKIRHTL